MECKHVQRIKLFAVAASSARKQTVRRKPAPAPMPRLQAEELQAPCPAGTARRGCMQGCPCGDCKMRFSENPECGPARRPPKRSRMRRARLRGPRQQEDRGPHARPGKGGRGRRGPAARRHGGRARAFLPRMAAYASRRAPPASRVWSTDGLRTRLRKAEHCRTWHGLRSRLVPAGGTGGAKAAGGRRRRFGCPRPSGGRGGRARHRRGAARRTSTGRSKRPAGQPGGKSGKRHAVRRRIRSNAASLRHRRLSRAAGKGSACRARSKKKGVGR